MQDEMLMNIRSFGFVVLAEKELIWSDGACPRKQRKP